MLPIALLFFSTAGLFARAVLALAGVVAGFWGVAFHLHFFEILLGSSSSSASS